MAPRKRSLRDEAGESSEAGALRTSDARKRVRVSDIVDESSLPPETSDSDDDDNVAPAHLAPLPQSQYEIMRDDGFKHLDNIEEDDHEAARKLTQRMRKVGNNVAAESGIIESITCFNFMCHDRLHVELGPLLNFIVGENGSGKSAVLTALTLCLGGKASDTNRGGSLRSFVKEGRDKARLVVKIKNCGSDAYQPDLYGDSIVVERHFSSTGSSGFKIKNSAGGIVSTKKQEVDEISEWYTLQIGNPLIVLSQDNARQFLNSSSPSQKYKFFVAGVQLEQLDNDYKMSQDTLDKTEILREDLNERIGSVKKEMESARRLAETAQKNNTLRDKARHYRRQLAWSQVIEQETELEKRVKALEEHDKRIAERQEACAQMTEGLESLDQKLQEHQQSREHLDQEREGFEDRIATAEADYASAKKDLTDLNREERDAHGRMKNAKSELKAIQEDIDKEEQRLAESTGPERAQKDSELADALSKEKDLIKKQEQLLGGKPEEESRLEKAQAEYETVSRTKELKRKEIIQAQKNIQEVKQSTGSALDGYDNKTRDLVMAIEEDNSFEHKPIGPMGAHIRLLDPEWSGILERTFGEALNAFVVRSKQDQQKLLNLMKRIRIPKPPPIYIAYSSRIDTSRQEPDEKYTTILRVLEFDNELVRAQMIINFQIEKIILIKSRVEAEKVMVDADVPPRNVNACMCFHDGQGKRGFGLRLTNRSGNTSTSPVPPATDRKRMRTDAGNHILVLQEHMKQLGTEMRELERQLKAASNELQEARRVEQGSRGQLKKLEIEIRKVQAEVQRVQIDLDAFEGVDGRLVQLREDLTTKENEIEGLGNQYGSIKVAQSDMHEKAKKAKEKLTEEQRIRDEYQGKVDKAEKKLKSFQDLRRIALGKKNQAFESLEIDQAERPRVADRIEQQREMVRNFTQSAEQVSPTRVLIPEGETFQSMERKYVKLREQLDQRAKRLGATDEQIYERSAAATKKYEDATKEIREVDETISTLKHSIRDRLNLWRQFQRQISARVRIQFTYLLSERGYRGKIELNHKSKKVSVSVEPDETKKVASARSTKTLSGGEKSFSSICMLLSIWEAIGSPIRCLDEFDVFMDNVNRSISTNMLVDVARRAVSRQYILITPNAIEGRASLAADVKIIRLTDPRQRTLPDMMAE
ncbi:unnamed protein product [Clonostachys rosea f. rosea IK726]|uniref:RecF/RecN/SMC N-terminal domain-containing protein n=2 Tax=Bionectria ochroleuca TaxID=29856 RepID=A0A0B7JPA1_BIOOC|nr:unnamed protein product [Clonostachys rosea f. rosea IK726]